MGLPAQGSPKDDVLEKLASFKDDDIAWESGRVMTNVFLATDEGRKVAEEAYTMYLWENGLDPTAIASLPRLEREVAAMAGGHLGGGEDVVGSFTSGGTESCMLAVKTARDRVREHQPEITRPNIVIPVTGHPAFHKGCEYFGVDAIVTPVDPETCRADVDALAGAIDDQTILVVASACSFPHGSVDPIREIGAVAAERDVLFHVDGCIGGFLLPLWREMGAEVTDFDFTVPGVTSMSMDFHKYALCAKGASIILYRDAELRRHQFFTYSDWPGYVVVNSTIQSSKSGGPIAAAWATLRHYGLDGYLEVAGALRAATARSMEIVASIDGLTIVGAPEVSVFAIGSDAVDGVSVDIFAVASRMEEKGWHMYPQLGGHGLAPTLHVTLLPWNTDRIDEWGSDLAAAVQQVRSAGSTEGGGLAALVADIDLQHLTTAEIEGLMDMAGIDAKALGGDMTEVNHLLDDLPPEVTDRVLRVFLDQLTKGA
jgi:glutamate/tyrosine decarboxylase-like PLP-dependent enzyme